MTIERMFGGILDAMQIKDASLLKRIGHMPINKGLEAWKRVHPEDDGTIVLTPQQFDMLALRTANQQHGR